MSDTRTNRRAGDGPVWALAAALTVIAAGRLIPSAVPAPPAADAGTVSSVGDMTVLTSSTGSGEDIVTVLDQRSGTVSVYRSTSRRGIELVQVAPIEELFDQARAAGPSNRR